MAAARFLDPDQVQGLHELSEELARRLMAWVPRLYHFRRDGRELVYVGAHHEEREGNATFRLLERAFEVLAPDFVVIEGCPYEKGPLIGRYLESMTRRDESGAYEGGERGYAALLAARRGVPVFGGEWTDRRATAAILARGHGVEDVLAHQFLIFLPQLWRLGKPKTRTLESVYEQYAPWIREECGLADAPPFGFEDLRRWYRARNGEDLEWRDFADFERLRPDARGPLFTQRLGHDVNMARNRFIAEVLDAEVRPGRRVMAVFGNGHVAAHWRMLTAAFGEPVYAGALEQGPGARPP